MTASPDTALTTSNATNGKGKRRTAEPPRRAAVYVRISMDHTGEGLGVQRQQEDAEAIIAARGWELAGVYPDNSISASDARKHRPGYAELQRDYAEGLFDALVVWDLDRLTRQPRQLEDWIDAAEGRGLALVTSNGECDLTTDAGRLFARIKAAVARSEIERKSARHKRALKQHAESGRIPHGTRLFGYTADGNVEPTEAAIITDVFDRFAGGESLRSLVRRLNEMKVPTRSMIVTRQKLDDANADGTAEAKTEAAAAHARAMALGWNTRTIRDMLVNPRYAGWALYQRQIATDKDGNPVRGQWVPLISEDTYAVVKAKLADPARKTNRVGTERKYLGSSLFVCDTCGGTVQTVNGGKYFCAGHLTREHTHVDRFVLDLIAERASRPDFARLVAPPSEDTKPLIAESDRLRTRLVKLKDDYLAELIEASVYKEGRERVQAQLRDIDKKLATRTGGVALGKIAASVDPAQEFRESSLMAQRAIIDALCIVRLRRADKGRMRTGADGLPVFNIATIDIQWRH